MNVGDTVKVERGPYQGNRVRVVEVNSDGVGVQIVFLDGDNKGKRTAVLISECERENE